MDKIPVALELRSCSFTSAAIYYSLFFHSCFRYICRPVNSRFGECGVYKSRSHPHNRLELRISRDINDHLAFLTMMSFVDLFMAILVILVVAAAPTGNTHQKSIEKRQSVRPGTGTSNGFFYSFWKDNAGSVTYSNHAGGGYSVTWNNVGNFVAGKGWKTGSAR